MKPHKPTVADHVKGLIAKAEPLPSPVEVIARAALSRGFDAGREAERRSPSATPMEKFGAKLRDDALRQEQEAVLSLPPSPSATPIPEQQCCTLAPPGWNCTRSAGHDGPCAAVPEGRTGPGIPMGSGSLRLPPQPEPNPERTPKEPQLNPNGDPDDGAVLAVKMPIDLGAMGQLAGVMAKIYPGRQIMADTEGSWAVFKLKP